MQKIWANAISYIFHPLLFPTYGTLIVLYSNPYLFGNISTKDKTTWLFLVFALTFLFPVVWLVMMLRLQMIDSLKLQTAKERIIPFIAVATFYLWTYRMFSPSAGNLFFSNEIIANMLMGAVMAIFIGFVTNIYSKVSLHTIGAGCFFALSLLLVRYSNFNLTFLIIASIIIAGSIGSARLILKAHQPSEVFFGYLIGVFGMFIAFSIIPRILG